MAMTVCRKCGSYSSDSDVFCGGCGSFLEWTGEAVAPTPAADAAPAETATPERHRSWFERLSTASGSVLAGRDLERAPLIYEPAKAGSGIGRPAETAAATGPAALARPGAPAAPARPGAPPGPPSGPPAGPPSGPPRPPGPPSAPPPPPHAPPPPPHAPPPPGPPSAPPPSAPPPPHAPPPPPPGPPSAPPAPAHAPPPPPALPSAHQEPPAPAPAPRAAAALVTPITLPTTTPPSEPTPEDGDSSGELLPQRARRDRAHSSRQVPAQPRQVGDLICGDCGTGNSASRKFCRQCGNSLATAEVQQATWWRKLIPRRRKKTMAAGTRPGRAGARKQRRNLIKSIYYKARTVGAVLVLLAGIFFGAYPPARTALLNKIGHAKSDATSALNHGLTEVHPTAVSGAALNPTDPAGKAFDGNRTTYWLGSFALVKTPILTITFPRKQVLREIIVSSGDQGNYVGHGRPRVLRLDLSNGKSTLLRLKDQSAPQTLPITGGVGVDKVSIRVEDVYQATQNKVSDVAIGEIEFFALL